MFQFYDSLITKYSVYPYTDQSGGIFTIINKINSVSVDSITGQLMFQPNLDIGNYQLQISYNINNISKQIYYNLTIGLNFYYPINNSTLIYSISGYSISPITYSDKGNYNITDICNNYILINQSNGILYFNNNIPVNNYSFNIIHNFNSVYSTSTYLLSILPYINYIPNITNLDYNTFGKSIMPTLLPTNSTNFEIFDVFCCHTELIFVIK